MTQSIMTVDRSKQDVVAKLCGLAKRYPYVKRMIVFGSAASNTCSEESDIDICFDISCDPQNIGVFNLNKEANKICDYNCDILFYNLLGTRLKSEIDAKGVVVYES